MNLWHAQDVLQIQGFAIYPLIPEMLLAIGALWLWNVLGSKSTFQQITGALALAVFYAGALSLSLLWIGWHMSTIELKQPFTLPCGVVVPNRLCKAAMTEGVANARLQATERHATLYKRWAEGGAGILITGNVLIDRNILERPGNVSIDPAPEHGEPEGMEALRAWAKAGTSNGNHLWMQISHAGRQSPRYWLNDEKIDLLEISGGTYEQPRLLGHTGAADSVKDDQPAVRESTKKREAYFLNYAKAIREVATMPLMVTGGFRSREAMEEAMNDGVCDVIGL
eukprot:gene8584-8396_t